MSSPTATVHPTPTQVTRAPRRGMITVDKAPPRRAARLALGLRRRLRRLADRLLPPEVLAWELATASLELRTVNALLEVGAIDALGRRSASAAELARDLQLHEDTLARVLRMAAASGLVRDRNGRYELTSLGEAFLGSHSPSIAPWARHLCTDAVQRGYAALPEALRTGEPPFPATHGRSVWEHLAAHPDEEQLFANAMRELSGLVTAAVLEHYPWPDSGTVCDVAGGSGPILAAILGARPDLRGVLVEAPGVLPEADRHLRAAGVRDRVELVQGNIFEGVEATADLYLLKDILHDWDDERSLRILRTVRAAMAPGAKLILIETILEPDRPDPIAVRVDIHMLTQCDGGRQRSVTELQGLLRAADLEPGNVHSTGAPAALIEGIARS